ncbi:elongation factor EF-1 gamma subunit [Pleosporales sp. CAS-2024a]
MRDDGREMRRSSGNSNEPAIQVICLGSGGGPSEDNVTGFLVRSTATSWSKNSFIAVDAGSHLAAITRILEQDFPFVADPDSASRRPRSALDGSARFLGSSSPATANISLTDDESEIGTPCSELEAPVTITTLKEGAFAGLPFPHASARANALHIVREHISTYLITHPHIDHISGFVINTAAFHNTSRPKRLAALPFTVDAIKTHIFNNVIWPNLTDEEGGVGLVTFQRLAEGGNIALGEGSGRGYIEVCDGLGVKGFKISHGHCMRAPALHRGSNVNLPETPAFQHLAATHHVGPTEDNHEGRSLSVSMANQSAPGTPGFSGGPDPGRRASGASASVHSNKCVVDSTAYFIRSESTLTTPRREILIFGDVEPDSVSLSPRTALIWAEAAPKIAAGILTGIFIEVSYTNSRSDDTLFGHLVPRHLLAELSTLAEMVKESKKEHEREREEARQTRKRKRASKGEALRLDASLTEQRKAKAIHLSKGVDTPLQATLPYTDDEMMTDYSRDVTGANTPNQPAQHLPCNSQPSTQAQTPEKPQAQPSTTLSAPAAIHLSHMSTEHNRALLAAALDAPLKGVKIVVIHVKDTFQDGPLVGDQILKELVDGEREMGENGKGLGCIFEISRSGGSYWF